MITLYDFELSGNCYKVRLLLGFLGLGHQSRKVDFYPGLEHRGAEFRELNPLGQLPVLDDDGVILRDAQAILVYLANRYDSARTWWPADDPVRVGQVAQWLAFADGLSGTAGAARLHEAFFFDLDVEAARSGARRRLAILDEHLWFAERQGADWIVPGPAPTVADIACFPYTALSEEGGVWRRDCPALRRWIDRFRSLDGFRVMPGIVPPARKGSG